MDAVASYAIFNGVLYTLARKREAGSVRETLPVQLACAGRRSVFAHPNWVQTYAHSFSADLLRRFDRIVSNAFSSRPDARLLQTLRDGFRVNVLLIDRADAVWASDALERSGVYMRVHSEPSFRIYRAKR